jgi:hypothetical protein
VRRRQLPYNQRRINAQEGREQRQVCGQKLRFRLTEMMISRFGVESQSTFYTGTGHNDGRDYQVEDGLAYVLRPESKTASYA